jgi:hypothetical protein
MRTARPIIMASLLAGFPIEVAQATPFCFNLSNYVDVFTINGPTGVDYAIYDIGRGYAIPVFGGTAPVPASGSATFFGLHGVNGSNSFGNHSSCEFYFIASGTKGTFTLNATCNGRVPGIWKKGAAASETINCVPAVPPTSPKAKAFGEAPSD